MKAYTKRERQGDIVQTIATCAIYATVLALNDLYGWRDAAEKVAVAVAEIVNGYCVQSIDENKDADDMALAELRVRGFDVFEVTMKKGGKQ